MLPGDNVIDLEGEPVVGTRDPAVLAAMARALPDLLNQEWVHGRGGAPSSDFRWRRALDWMIDRRLPTCR
jgi:hypothetical protein